MPLQRYAKFFLFLFFVIPVFLGAQERHYTERYKQYRLFYTVSYSFPDSSTRTRHFFVDDSLSGNVVEMKLLWIRYAHFRNGFIEVGESDMHALYTVDGKLLAHFCRGIYYPCDSFAIAESESGCWQIFNLEGELVASTVKTQSYYPGDFHFPPYAGKEIIAVCAWYNSLPMFALISKRGYWITANVIDSVGIFANGQANAKYKNHKGILYENGMFVCSDSAGKINLAGTGLPFAGLGPPYRYMNGKNKIVFADSSAFNSKQKIWPPIQVVSPSKSLPVNTVNNPQQQKIVSPAVKTAAASVNIKDSNVVSNSKQTAAQGIDSNIFVFHFLAKQSHYKIIWRYSDISKSTSHFHDGTVLYNKNARDYFLVDTLANDTVCLLRETDPYAVTFSSSFIFLVYNYAHPAEIFTLNGKQFLPGENNLNFDPADSVIIADNYKKGGKIFDWNGNLIFADSSVHDIYRIANKNLPHTHLLTAQKTVDPVYHLSLHLLMNTRGNFITDAVFSGIGDFDSAGTAPTTLCDGRKGRVDTTGIFFPEGQQQGFRPTVALLLADKNYATIKIVKGKFRGNQGSYHLAINPYCYDKHVVREDYVQGKYDRRYIYYYNNGKLVGEEDIDFDKHVQVLTCYNNGRKTQVVNRHYATFINPWP